MLMSHTAANNAQMSTGNLIMAKPIPYEVKIRNENENQKARQRALENARTRMKREGVEYPYFDATKTLDEHYEAMRNYGELESRYMLEFLKMPSGPRPIIEYKDDEIKKIENLPYKD